jgi:mannosyl-oligosaccharide alpha-1,2-mannosidase
LQKRQKIADFPKPHDQTAPLAAAKKSKLTPTQMELQKKLDATDAELDAISDAGRAQEQPLRKPNDEALVDPSIPMTHAEYVANRIKKETLPLGFTRLRERKYILR